LHHADNTNHVSSLCVRGPTKTRLLRSYAASFGQHFQRHRCLHCRSQAASLFFDCFTPSRKALRTFQTPLNHRVSFIAVPSTATATGRPGDRAAVLGTAYLNNATSHRTCSSCNIPARTSKVKICVRQLPGVWQLTMYGTQDWCIWDDNKGCSPHPTAHSAVESNFTHPASEDVYVYSWYHSVSLAHYLRS
jgi:hypothetical protein